MTENCAGKALVEEQLKAISDKDAATLVSSQKLIEEWLPKLKNDLCCVKVPRIVSYFKWKSFWWKNKLVYENIPIENGKCGRPEDYNEQYIIIEIYRGDEGSWGYLHTEEILLYTHQGRMITTSISNKCEEYTYDEAIKKIAEKIANYGSKVIKKYNRNNN